MKSLSSKFSGFYFLFRVHNFFFFLAESFFVDRVRALTRWEKLEAFNYWIGNWFDCESSVLSFSRDDWKSENSIFTTDYPESLNYLNFLQLTHLKLIWKKKN